MNIFCRAMAFCFLGLLSQNPLYAQGRSLIVVTEEWPPFRISDPSAPSGYRGIDIDVLEALGAKLGVRFEIRRHPWARALELVRLGQADVIMGIAHTPEREEYIYYPPSSYVAVRPRLITRKGLAASVRSYADLAGKLIGQSISSAYFEPYNSDESLNKLKLSNEEKILAMLALGRLDVAVGTDPNLSWDILRFGHSGLFEYCEYQPEDMTPLYMGLSRTSGVMELADAFEEATRGLLASGAIDRILARYR